MALYAGGLEASSTARSGRARVRRDRSPACPARRLQHGAGRGGPGSVDTHMARRVTATDEELAQRTAASDQAAYEELVERYAQWLRSAAHRILGNADDAADAAQDTLIQLYVALPRTRLDLPLRPWLFRVLRNRCLDLLRRRRTVPFSAFASDGGSPNPVEAVADTQPAPDEVFAHRDLQVTLRAAIASLPLHYRNVVALRYTTDLTFAGIATSLGLPENTVKTHFHRAKLLVRRFLVKRGEVLESTEARTHSL